MNLSETGEARVRGYLFILGRSLRSFLPRDVAADALKEIEGHLRERLALAESMPNEAAAVERVLQQVGAPLQVARAYSTEVTVEEAVASGRLVATLRALWLLGTATVGGFASGLALFVGYAFGIACLLAAVLTLVDPRDFGLIVVGGVPQAFGTIVPMPQGAVVHGGPIPALGALAVGALALVLTHLAARRLLGFWRRRLKGGLGADADAR